MASKDFIDWCFKNLDGTEDKFDLGHKVWVHLMLENSKLVRKLTRLDKLLSEFKLSVDEPISPRKRYK